MARHPSQWSSADGRRGTGGRHLRGRRAARTHARLSRSPRPPCAAVPGRPVGPGVIRSQASPPRGTGAVPHGGRGSRGGGCVAARVRGGAVDRLGRNAPRAGRACDDRPDALVPGVQVGGRSSGAVPSATARRRQPARSNRLAPRRRRPSGGNRMGTYPNGTPSLVCRAYRAARHGATARCCSAASRRAPPASEAHEQCGARAGLGDRRQGDGLACAAAVALGPKNGDGRPPVFEQDVPRLPLVEVIVTRRGDRQQREITTRCGPRSGRFDRREPLGECCPAARAPGGGSCGISGAGISLRNIGRTGGCRAGKPRRWLPLTGRGPPCQ